MVTYPENLSDRVNQQVDRNLILTKLDDNQPQRLFRKEVRYKLMVVEAPVLFEKSDDIV